MRKHAGIAALLVAALALRLVWGFIHGEQIDSRLPDQQEYLQLAENLLNGYGLSFYDTRFYQVVYAYRMPGYPLFIAAGRTVHSALFHQKLIDTLTVLGTYLLARRWLGKGPSLIAAAAVAFNPFMIYFSSLLLSETLYTALLVWGCVLVVRHPNFLFGGIVLALSVLVRPSAVALPVLLGIVSVFVNYVPGLIEGKRSWLRLPVGTTMVVLVVIVLFPWALRNKIRLGQWVWLTTNGGVTRYDGFNPDATGASDQRFLNAPEFRVLRHVSEVERDEYLSQQAGIWIRETLQHDPLRLVRLTAIKIARTWSPIPLSAEFGGKTIYMVAAAAYSIPLLTLSVVGLWASRLPRSARLFLLSPVLYFTMIHAVSVGSLRYRVPTEPLLAVLAAAGLMTIFDRLNRRRRTAERPQA
jgi:4-amino-4-deoxy-L-arabinose transferase-like glycosyltransferase